MVTPAAGNDRLRASHADRDQVVDALKAAFVHGRLTQDELDARVGQALAARTYAELAALTADLPPSPAPAPAPAAASAPPARRPRNMSAKLALKAGAGAMAATIIAVTAGAFAAGQPQAAAVLAVITVILGTITMAFVATLIAVVLKIESRWHNRSGRQLPPRPASGAGGQASPRPPRPGPDRPGPPQLGPPQLGPDRRRPRHPPGALAIGRAG
jgi:hypothetical protein